MKIIYTEIDDIEYKTRHIELKFNKSINNYYVCLFKIVNEKYQLHPPFIGYLLKKHNSNSIDPMYNFPKASFDDNDHLYIDFKFFNDNSNLINYKGYQEYNNNIYLLYECNEDLDLNKNIDNYNLVFATTYELLNTNHIYGTDINEDACDLFSNNLGLNMLLNPDTNENYEVPTTFYTYKNTDKVNFTEVFGEIKSQGIMGNYYYFSNYDNIINHCLKNNIKYVFRFSCFLGSCKVILNRDSDEIDRSTIKQQKLEEEAELNGTFSNFEKLTGNRIFGNTNFQ
jgi:hypothetical protein